MGTRAKSKKPGQARAKETSRIDQKGQSGAVTGISPISPATVSAIQQYSRARTGPSPGEIIHSVTKAKSKKTDKPKPEKKPDEPKSTKTDKPGPGEAVPPKGKTSREKIREMREKERIRQREKIKAMGEKEQTRLTNPTQYGFR